MTGERMLGSDAAPREHFEPVLTAIAEARILPDVLIDAAGAASLAHTLLTGGLPPAESTLRTSVR